MPKLDDASWHYGSDEFPDGIPEANAATHIGMFVTWAIANRLWGDFLGEAALPAIQAVRERKMSGRDFVLEQCDGKLLSEMLTADATAFSQKYYPKAYMRDFQAILSAGLPSDYHVQDTRANYEKLAMRINERFEAWKRKPWWQFW
jgi:hypothetical protein